MLIPRGMPVELAWLNGQYGAPMFGPFTPCPAPPDELAEWALTIPWAVNMLGSVMGRVALVLPPTLPGVAWMIRDRLSVVDIAWPVEPLGLQQLKALCFGGVQWAGAVEVIERSALYGIGIRLSPATDPPSRSELRGIAGLFRPGAILVLAFRADEAAPLDLPPEWDPVRGDLRVIPGLAAFNATSFAQAQSAAWRGPCGTIAVVGCERTS